jgi:hypothetical protein
LPGMIAGSAGTMLGTTGPCSQALAGTGPDRGACSSLSGC